MAYLTGRQILGDGWLVWGIASFLVHVNLGVMEFTSRVGLSSFVVIDFTVLGQFQFRHRVHDSGLDMGVSENSVPLNPMVLLIIIPIKWLFHWEYTLFSDKPILVISPLSR